MIKWPFVPPLAANCVKCTLAKNFGITHEANTPKIFHFTGRERWMMKEIKLCPSQAAAKLLSQVWRVLSPEPCLTR